MTYSYWKKLSQLPSQSDVVIVGGGFIGLSVAFWLNLKKPHLKIIVIDSQPLGEGASGRNAGFLTKGSLSFYEHLTMSWGGSAAEEIFHFAQESIELVREKLSLKDSLPTASYTLYTQRKDFSFKGFERVSPLFSTADCFKGEGEISINPITLLTELEELVTRRGISVYRGVECFEIEKKVLHTNFGSIEGSEVVLALNGHTSSLIPHLVTPQRAQMLCVETINRLEIPGLIYEPDSRVYFKSIGKNKLVIGGKRLIDPLSEVTPIVGINKKIQSALEDYVRERLGEIKSIEGRWSGIMGFSPDELPIVEKRGDYYLIAGFSGHGMGFGFNASLNLSDMIIENKTSFFQSIRTRCRDNKA